MRRVSSFCLVVLLAAGGYVFADQRLANWMGDFAPCETKYELLRYDDMDLGVRLSTSNPVLAREFKKAMGFWAQIVHMRWREDGTSACSVQLVDGNRTILGASLVARAQFTDWTNFQGWIAFDPNAPLSRSEMYVTAVHEIGHVLGLTHNPNPDSVMYYSDLGGREILDDADLTALAAHHRLRLGYGDRPIAVTRPRFSEFRAGTFLK